MDYFKHYSTASDSKSINVLFDQFGHKGIAFYWLLVELCSENWDGDSEPEFSFHQRTVVTKLKSSLNSVLPWFKLCSNEGLCAFAHSGTQMFISMPKLRKTKETRGRIKGNKPEKTHILDLDKDLDLDQDKEKEIVGELSKIEAPQEKLKIISSEKFTPDHFVDLWNASFGEKLSHCVGLGGGVHLKNFLESLQYLPTEKHWRDLFQICIGSPKLMGQNSISWAISPLWIVNYDNALKVLNGDFDDDKAVKQLFAAMEQGDAV